MGTNNYIIINGTSVLLCISTYRLSKIKIIHFRTYFEFTIEQNFAKQLY